MLVPTVPIPIGADSTAAAAGGVVGGKVAALTREGGRATVSPQGGAPGRRGGEAKEAQLPR